MLRVMRNDNSTIEIITTNKNLDCSRTFSKVSVKVQSTQPTLLNGYLQTDSN